MRYFISDQHFYHSNIINIDGRLFSSVLEMNEYMIEKWNSRVKVNDEVYILGDLSLGTSEETNLVLQRMKGKKYLVVGNHDSYIHDKDFNKDLFVWVKKYAEIRDENRRLVLCHYPVFCYNGQHFRTDNGESNTYMLYGHVHNSPDAQLIHRFVNETRAEQRLDRNGNEYTVSCNMINCFCMYSDYIPLSLDEWIEVERNQKPEEI